MGVIGKSVTRKDAGEKVTGAARYVNDRHLPRLLHAKYTISPHAHARIKSIDTAPAWQVPGVRAVILGEQVPILTGPILADRPPLAIGKVRYAGEPVALIVADEEHQAELAASRLVVEYELLPVVNGPLEAFADNAPLVHEDIESYHNHGDVYPQPGTNIANLFKIRKGDMAQGWATGDVVVEAALGFPQSDHAAIETRCVQAEVTADGQVILHTPSQAPYEIPEQFERFFGVPAGQVVVHTPLVGGGFGGKGAVQLEFLAYLATKAVDGRPVQLLNSRERDLISSPVHIGLEARVRLGATCEGKFTALEIFYWFDGGAYSQMGVVMNKAAGIDCTGPYRVDHVHVDSYCMYTNHPYSTSFRGFGHPEMTFVIERAVDLLAKRLGIDPLVLRAMNAIQPGDTSPTRALLDYSNLGDVSACIERVGELIRWDEGVRQEVGPHKVRAKGMAALWKTSTSATDAGASAVLTFNRDGSANISVGVVEIGQGTRTVMAQLVAERLHESIDRVHVSLDVNTRKDPEHWKTVASSSVMLSGRAVLQAADDAIRQIKEIGAVALRAAPDDLAVARGRVFLRSNPAIGMPLEKVVHGYRFPNGNAIGGHVVGHGHYLMHRVTRLEHETGQGKPGPEWTVGAEAIEVELDLRDCTYRLVRAAAVIDAGRVLHPHLATGQVMGGMHMGLSFGSREHFVYSERGVVLNPQFRSYKLLHYGEHPEYLVDFVERPYLEGPLGARGVGEYGLIGMPAALANALSVAAGVELYRLPLLPEQIWRARGGDVR